MDTIDEAQNNVLAEGEYLSHVAHEAAAKIPAGVPGECHECGEQSKRLVDGRCAPCRDDSGLAFGILVY